MVRKKKHRLNITIGAEYISPVRANNFSIGKEVRTITDAIDIDNNKIEGTVFESSGVRMSSKPVFREVLNVGSGAFGLQTIADPSMDMSTLATCENPSYSGGIDILDSGNGYMFMQNLEFRQGNVVHWGVEASGVSTTIDKITYDNFAAIGMMNPGEQAAFRLSPTGPKIKFVSASGEAAIAESGAIKQSRDSRLSYTIFPR